MAIVSSMATQKLVGILSAQTGLPIQAAEAARREGVDLAVVTPAQVMAQNVSTEIAEKATGVKYPVFHVYCDRVQNLLQEKFRSFSGKCRLVIEVRVSQDRLEGLERQLQLYTDAATQVLDTHRGDWGGGAYYAGGYEAGYSGIRHGGKNFLQTAKISLELDVSLN